MRSGQLISIEESEVESSSSHFLGRMVALKFHLDQLDMRILSGRLEREVGGGR
jgi:hypothetical protein